MQVSNWHFQSKILKRSENKNAIAAAAYRAGEALKDEKTGKVFDYSRRQKILATEIIAPENAPAWVHDRTTLWNRVEASEKRKDAQLARELEIALPHELDDAARADLVRDFCRRNFAAAGMIADMAVHGPGKGDQRNHHAHIMLTMRHVGPEDFAGKAREWNANELLDHWKEDWEKSCNEALRKANKSTRLDRRSIKKRYEAELKKLRKFRLTGRLLKQAEALAERLNYTPRPHLPQTIYRAMVEGKEMPAEWAEKVQKWKEAIASRDEAVQRVNEMLDAIRQEAAAAREAKEREAEQARQKEAQDRQRAAQEAKEREAEQARQKEAQEAEEAFEPAIAAFAPISSGRLDLSGQKGAWRALWMFFDPKDAREARAVLKLPENASFSEVRSKMAKADAEDKHKIQHIEMRSSSFKRFEQIGSLFAFSPPKRENWQAFFSRLDDWGKDLISKITKLAAPQNVDLKSAQPEAKSASEGKRDEAPKPYRPSNGPSM